MVGGVRELPEVSLLGALMAFQRPYLQILILGIGTERMNLWGDTHIQFITGYFPSPPSGPTERRSWGVVTESVN